MFISSFFSKVTLFVTTMLGCVIGADTVQENCNILALSGGGSFGAVEMGMLDSLIEQSKIVDKYDIVTGVSVGGLNAGFLSFYTNVSNALPEIKKIYSDIRNGDVYVLKIFDMLSSWSVFDTTPLRKTVTDIFKTMKRQEPRPITLVGSSNVIKHTFDVFKLNDLNDTEKIDVMMATSAIPVLFDPQRVFGSIYVDGGAISNEIFIQAFGEKKCNYYDILFISAGTHKPYDKPINNFLEYLEAVIDMVTGTFNYQLAEFSSLSCNYPIGTLKACFPSYDLHPKYSIYDFDHGAELYEIGKLHHYCEIIKIC